MIKCIKIYIINLKRVSINRAIFTDIVPDDFHYDWSQHEPLEEKSREHPELVPRVRVGAGFLNFFVIEEVVGFAVAF